MAVMDQMGFTPFRRDEILQPRDFRTTFSTWDNCMAKTYCKWPVVIGIAIGSIILIGVIWGIVACACCGYTCCKGCCACCSCCCPSRDKSHNRTKFADEPSAYNARNRRHSTGYQRPPAPPVYDSHHSTPAKFAQFDTVHPRSKSNDDALPQMPTWDSAKTRRVEEVSPPSDVEMNRLDPATGQNFKPQSFSRPVRYNNNTNSGGNSYYDRTPTSSAYSPTFDGYRGPEATTHQSRSPSPGNPFGHADAIGIATSHPPTHQHHQYFPPRSPSPEPVTPYPPYTEVPTATTAIMPNAMTTHTTMSPPPTHPREALQRYPPAPMPHPPSPPATRSYSPYPPPQPVPQLQHLRQHSPTQSPTHQSPRYLPQQQGQNQAYAPYSPASSVPNTPPPPFSSTLGDYDQILPGAQHGQYGTGIDAPPREQAPPSALQVGRAPPGPKSWRDV
ncbi:conserved hypothetical protein [Histoplasma capsulatum G186AR]|uniref:Uncharacterized protein n=1 Tax=Ajellomyces capsulatus (strain G186AR / H82 / ATCC MYA-2454 / RMSCC 2432) TaxID=447093 RepID=C0NSE1_AJECG|nr:uncharacterized protein HCBG_06071 [Histoplasma capsulatum G186AR]EEH05808.1 conserved hypothetical protein [Histoplasma capsulatum G186AR]QSS67347.1 hypothetical protein I7I50_06393 [Histoplasma capsulatum G186AR]